MNYQKHYDKLIERAKSRNLEGYKESHHIIPRCMGGSDDKSNLADLTASEHFLAHQLLIKIYPGNQRLLYAAMMMANSSETQVRTNKLYKWIKEKIHSTPRDNEWCKNISNGLKGRSLSEDHKRKVSISMTGVKKSDSMRERMSVVAKNRTKEHQDALNKSNTGNKRSEETKAKMRLVSSRQELITCPHCGKTGKPRGMKCWHFDKCKEKPHGL